MTGISEVGEFGLIHHLTDNIKLKNASSIKGVGDDAAVLEFKNQQTLVTTDLLMEGVHVAHDAIVGNNCIERRLNDNKP
jgi:thiamine-monophosphate kinase